MAKSTRITFLLPHRYEVALRKLRQTDPSIRTRTDAIIRVIHAGLNALQGGAPAPRGGRL